VHVYYNNNVS